MAKKLALAMMVIFFVVGIACSFYGIYATRLDMVLLGIITNILAYAGIADVRELINEKKALHNNRD